MKTRNEEMIYFYSTALLHILEHEITNEDGPIEIVLYAFASRIEPGQEANKEFEEAEKCFDRLDTHSAVILLKRYIFAQLQKAGWE